jgi:hypothetical protein
VCSCGRADYELGFAETAPDYSMRGTNADIGDAVRLALIGRNALPLASFWLGVKAVHHGPTDLLYIVDSSGGPAAIRMVGDDGAIWSPAIANIASTTSMRIVGIEPGSAIASLLGAGQLRSGIEEFGRYAWMEFTVGAPPDGGSIEPTPDNDMCPANELLVLRFARSDVFLRGEAEVDGRLTVTDAIVVLQYLFLGGEEPPCLEAINTNDDAELNILDPIFLLRYLFLGGDDPPAPGPAGRGLPCGKDPDDSISFDGCASFDGCGGE